MVPEPSWGLPLLQMDHLNSAPLSGARDKTVLLGSRGRGPAQGLAAVPRVAERGKLLSPAPFLPVPKAPWWRGQRPAAAAKPWGENPSDKALQERGKLG